MPNTEERHPFIVENDNQLPQATPFGGVTSSYGEENDWNYFFNQAGSRGPKGSAERRQATQKIKNTLPSSLIGTGSETPGYASVAQPHLPDRQRKAS